MPGPGDSLIVLGLAAVLVGPLLCFVMAVVLSIRGRKEAAKGWLLGGLAAPVVGFGSCVLGFFVGA